MRRKVKRSVTRKQYKKGVDMAKKDDVKEVKEVKKETVVEYASGLEVPINHKPDVEVKK
jgi:hypothetical protein